MSLKERAEKLRTDIPAVYLALRERETPVYARILAGVTVAYALSPIDLIPDFIPVLGYLDDLVILPALVALTVRGIPDETLRRCREKAAGLRWDGGPKKWACAIPFAVFRLLLIAFLVKIIWF